MDTSATLMKSEAQLPVHVYEAAGVYTVSLRMSGPGGSDLLVRRGYITVTGGQRVYLPLLVRNSADQARSVPLRRSRR